MLQTAFIKISMVIESCESKDHLLSAKNMIETFSKRYTELAGQKSSLVLRLRYVKKKKDINEV
jgi:hypothetical protein